VLLADHDVFAVDFDHHESDGGQEVLVMPAILHQHLEVHQTLGLLAQPGQLVHAGALEGELLAVEGLVVGSANGCAGPVALGIAILDAVFHPAFFPNAAADPSAHGPPGLRTADTAFGAGAIAPKLLAEAVEAAFEDAAALGLGDALVGVEHEALLALAGLHAGRGTAVSGHRGGVAGGGTGSAAQGVVAVLGAGERCQRDRTPTVTVEMMLLGRKKAWQRAKKTCLGFLELYV